MRLSSTLATSKLLLLVSLLLLGLSAPVRSQTACDNCITCNAGRTACTNCKAGYYLTGAGRCSVCSTTCSECRGTATYCTNCKQGFLLFGDVCNACTAGCAYCSSTAVNGCMACLAGYFDNRGGCTKCPEGCTDCTGVNSCTQCTSGYEISSGKCVVQGSMNPPPPSGLQGGAIAGIVIGGIVVLVIIGVIVYCINKKPKQSTADFLATMKGNTQMGSGNQHTSFDPSRAPMNGQPNALASFSHNGPLMAAPLPPGFSAQPMPLMQPMGYGQPYPQPSGPPMAYSVPLQAQPAGPSPIFAKA